MKAEIMYYAVLKNCTKVGAKTPKYTITKRCGFYPPMERLVGRDGRVSMFLVEGFKGDAVRLQAKDCLNFTEIKHYIQDGRLTEYGYGFPFDKATYSSRHKQNPFFENKEDCFLFLIHQDSKEPSNPTPTTIEFIVLSGARVLAAAYCRQLALGGFDEELQALRQQAQAV